MQVEMQMIVIIAHCSGHGTQGAKDYKKEEKGGIKTFVSEYKNHCYLQ